MSSPNVIIEVRPRLQVCHVFVKDIRVEAVDLGEGHLKVVYNEGRSSFKVIIPGVELKPNSLSNFTLVTNTKHIDSVDGTYFRIQTSRCNLTHSQISLFDYNARDTSFVPRVELGAPQAIHCRCCDVRLTRPEEGLCFRRVLPLPSDSWDMSDMFCHVHEGDIPSSPGVSSHLQPKPGDLLYGAYNFILSSTSLVSANPSSSVANPTNSAANPTNSAANPTSSASNPTNSAANPTNNAANPTNSAANPTNSAVNKTNSAANQAANASSEDSNLTNHTTGSKNQVINQENTNPNKTPSVSTVASEENHSTFHPDRSVQNQDEPKGDHKISRDQETPEKIASPSTKQIPPPLTNVQWGMRVVSCDQCASWLGTRQGKLQVTLWNSTVQFKEVREGNGSRFDEGRKIEGQTGREYLNKCPSEVKQNSESEVSLKNRSLGSQTVEDSSHNSPIKVQETSNSGNPLKNLSSNSQNGTKTVSKPDESNAVDKNVTHNSQNSTNSSVSNKSETMKINQQSRQATHPYFSSQDRVALTDFIAVVKENLGVNSKLLIQCQVTDFSQQSLLLWIMDRNLTLVTVDGVEDSNKTDIITRDESANKKDQAAKCSKQGLVPSNRNTCYVEEENFNKPKLNNLLNENSNILLNEKKRNVERASRNTTDQNGTNISGEGANNVTHNNSGKVDQIGTDRTLDQGEQLAKVKVSTVMKVLYTFAKDKPDPNWSKDFGLPHINVSKVMFLNALRHLRMQGQNIPAPYRVISEMHVSYIVLG